MDEQTTHEVTLIGGYEDSKKAVHRRVVFGHRVTGAELFRLDTDPQAQNPTQYHDLIMREAIIEFGSLPMKDKKGNRQRVPLPALLDLDSIDRDDLIAAHSEFAALSMGDRQPSVMPPDKVKLAFGFTIGELNYDFVVFGRRLIGRDDVQADKLELTGIARMCYRAGRQISRVATACSKCAGVGSVEDKPCVECKGTGYVAGSELEGPIDLEFFNPLDGVDIQIIGAGADLWRQTFRLRGRGLSGNRDGANSAPAGDENGLDRGSDSVAAGSTA
jgi:hypothetical protein